MVMVVINAFVFYFEDKLIINKQLKTPKIFEFLVAQYVQYTLGLNYFLL